VAARTSWHGAEAREQLREPLYEGEGSLPKLFLRTDTLLLLTFMATFNLKSSFYIVSLEDQLTAFGLSLSTVNSISTTFNTAFPVGGFVSSFCAMALLQRFRRSEHVYMTFVLILAAAFALSNLVPYEAAQYVAALAFGPTRTIQWAAYFLFLEQPDRYPPAKLGRMIGYANLIIALVGDGPPTALKAYASANGGAWPGTAFGRYQLVHSVTTLVVVGCLAFPVYLARDIRRRSHDRSSFPFRGCSLCPALHSA